MNSPNLPATIANGERGNSTELVCGGTAAQLLQQIRGLQSSTLRPGHPDDALTALTMETSEQGSLWEDTPESIDAIHVSVTPCEVTIPDTGEIVQALRTTFITPDGSVWGTNSTLTARAALTFLRSFENRGPLTPAVRFNFTKRKLGARRTALICTIDPESVRAALAAKSIKLPT